MNKDLHAQSQAVGIDLDLLIKQALDKAEKMLQDGFYKESEMILKQFLKVVPDNQQAYQLYGLILFKDKKYKESIEMTKEAIKLNPENPENYNNVALSYLHSGNNEEALKSIQKAVELNKSNHNFLNNLAMIYRACGDLQLSIFNYEESLALSASESRTWQSLGSVYGQLNNLAKAEECLKKALECDPTNLAPHIDLAYVYHLTGRWDEAWPEYEYRLEYWHKEGKNPGRFYEIYPPEKAWNGKDSLDGKKVVVYCEQGTGDMLQFVRFVPRLTALGANVTIDAPESLATLFGEIAWVETGHTKEYDYNCSIMSLPYLLNIKSDDFGKGTPYLGGTHALNTNDYKDFMKVGIVWAGNPGHPNDANRSCHLANFREISQLPNVKLFSLQKETGKRVYVTSPDKEIDLAEGCADIPLVDMSELMEDYAVTANIIDAMDLIITVDTSVLHLAGACGKETWALIPYNPDWRWGATGSDNVWYESVTLFRQTIPGDWSNVFAEIYKKLYLRSLLFNAKKEAGKMKLH